MVKFIRQHEIVSVIAPSAVSRRWACKCGKAGTVSRKFPAEDLFEKVLLSFKAHEALARKRAFNQLRAIDEEVELSTEEHMRTTGMHVAMGMTCLCGKWFRGRKEWLDHLREHAHE